MKTILPSLLLSFSVFINIGMGVILYATKSESFKTIVTAAQSIQDSRADIRHSVLSFNTAVANIEAITVKVESKLGKVEDHVKDFKADLDRIKTLLDY